MRIEKIRRVKYKACTEKCACRYTLYQIGNKYYYDLRQHQQYKLVGYNENYLIVASDGQHYAYGRTKRPELTDAYKLSNIRYLVLTKQDEHSYANELVIVSHQNRNGKWILNVYDRISDKMYKIWHKCYLIALCNRLAPYTKDEQDYNTFQEYHNIYGYDGKVGEIIKAIYVNGEPKVPELLKMREQAMRDITFSRIILNWHNIITYIHSDDVIETEIPSRKLSDIKVYRDRIGLYYWNNIMTIVRRYNTFGEYEYLAPSFKYNANEKELKKIAYIMKKWGTNIQLVENVI